MPQFGLDESFGVKKYDTTWAEPKWMETWEEADFYAPKHVRNANILQETLDQGGGFQKQRENRDGRRSMRRTPKLCGRQGQASL